MKPQSGVPKKRRKPIESHGAPMGRPPKYDETEIHTVVIPKYLELCKKGYPDKAIAGKLEVAVTYFLELAKKNKDFSEAMARGHELREATFFEIGMSGMIGQKKIDSRLYDILTRNILKWGREEKEDEKPLEDNGDVTYRAKFGA